MSHAFFASYATADNNSKYLQKVVLDLRERVRGRLGAPDAAAVGFFAMYDGVLTAQVWEEKLSAAARRARVIVLFCSNTYFNSEYCAKEFDIFRRRLSAATGKGDVIVPVIWDLCTLPEAISRYQASDLSAFPNDYRTQGLLALRRNKTARASYESTLDALTGVIDRALKSPALPALEPPVPFADLLDTFDNPDVASVRVGALHRDGLRWQLDPALGKTAVRVVEAVTASQRLPWRALKIDDGIVATLQAAQLAREAVALLVDDSDAEAGAYAVRRQAVDALSPSNCAILVGRTDGAQPLSLQAAESRLQLLFPKMSAAGRTQWFASDSALETVLAERIVKLRMAMTSEAPATRMSDTGMSEAAGREGISLDAPAILSGPGGQLR